MVIGLINQAVYLCDRKSKEGGMKKKENGRWNNKTSISIIIFIFIFIGVTSMNACGFLGFGSTEKWKEEVNLSDGRIIVVERERVLESGGGEWASNRRGLKPKENHIRFINPDGSGKAVEYRTLKKSSMLFPEIPLILDLENGQPVIYTLVGVRDRCEAYNKYVYRNGVWNEETLPEKFEPHITNLLVRSSDNVPNYVNLETKRKEIEDARRPVRQVGPTREICG
jgi:hypothetical protein